MLGISDGSKKAKVLFDKMDINRNGLVEQQEFMHTCETADNKMIF